MVLPKRMKFGTFLAPFHKLGENPTLGLERDLELVQWLDYLGFDEAFIGEHHSAGWETISSPELFIASVAERTRHIKLGTEVMSLPYHNPLMAVNRMIQLDHITRGRVMLGVGPGALASDAYMLGIDPRLQRKRMEESLDVIMKLLLSKDPVTVETDWFKLQEARTHLSPYTQPHFPIVVANSQSPSGIALAGKHGLGTLSLSEINRGSHAKSLSSFWTIAEEQAAKHNKTVSRNDWRIVIVAHLADSKKEAIKQAREGSKLWQYDYFEQTMGFDRSHDCSPEEYIDKMVDTGVWVIGTPDDLVKKINELDQESGGFGGLLVISTEFGNRQQVMYSYELLARYVMPQFQGSLTSLENSAKWTAEKAPMLWDLRKQSLKIASEDYKKK